MGGVIWITGVSGTGKTTLAAGVVTALRARHAAAIHLDGDALRAVLGREAPVDYTPEARALLALQYARLALLVSTQGAIAVASVVALRHDVHRLLRERASPYVEVWLRRREPAARHDGPAVGRELPAEYPLAPDVVLDNDGPVATLPRLVDVVLAAWDRNAHG